MWTALLILVLSDNKFVQWWKKGCYRKICIPVSNDIKFYKQYVNNSI